MAILDKNFIKEELEKANSIYDFIVIIFYFLSKSETNAYIKNYYKMMKNKDFKKLIQKLSALFYNFFMINDGGTDAFFDFKQMWLDLYDENNLETYCFATLINFDQNYHCNKNLSNETITIQGPLNNSLSDKVLFFNNAPDGYFSEYFRKNGIWEGKSKISFNPSSLNSNFSKFHIVETTYIGHYKPKVKKYNQKIELDNNCIAIIPCENNNVSLIFDKETRTISAEYKSEYFDKHLNYILNTLKILDEDGSKIVIFPELFLFPNSVNILRKKLCEKNFKNIKLVMTGSAWSNRTNCAYILSSSGKLLLSHKKKIAYEEYKKADGINYIEDIEIDNSFEFLDIEGIGRISYVICKDFLSSGNNCFCQGVMKSNIIFVSSYTHKTNLMDTTSQANATQYGIATVLCNCCTATKSNDPESLLGFMIFPKAENKKLHCHRVPLQKQDEKCDECGNCYPSEFR